MKESRKAIDLSGSSLKESWAIMAAVVRLEGEAPRPARSQHKMKPVRTAAAILSQRSDTTSPPNQAA